MIIVPQDVYLFRDEICNLDDEEILNYYDNLCETYENNPDGFDKQDAFDVDCPFMWYTKLIRELLQYCERQRKPMKIVVIMLIYKISIQFRNLFQFERFSGRYRTTALDKAHELLEDPDATNELKNVLRYFLNVV